MSAASLLPPGIGDARGEVLAELIAARFDGLDLSPLLIYRLDDVPDHVLPLLGWQFHVMGREGWDLAATPAQQRALIRQAIELHRRKGTPWAVREAIRRAGYPAARLDEGIPQAQFDGASGHAGGITYGDAARWAEFRVWMELGDQPLTAARTAQLVGLINEYKNARSWLDSIFYSLAVGDAAAGEDAGAPFTVEWAGADPALFVPRYDGRRAFDSGVFGADAQFSEDLVVVEEAA